MKANQFLKLQGLRTNRPKVERTIDKAFAFGIHAALKICQEAAGRGKYHRPKEHGSYLSHAQTS